MGFWGKLGKIVSITMISVGAVGTAGFGALLGVGANKEYSVTVDLAKLNPTSYATGDAGSGPTGPETPSGAPTAPTLPPEVQKVVDRLNNAFNNASKAEFSIGIGSLNFDDYPTITTWDVNGKKLDMPSAKEINDLLKSYYDKLTPEQKQTIDNAIKAMINADTTGQLKKAFDAYRNPSYSNFLDYFKKMGDTEVSSVNDKGQEVKITVRQFLQNEISKNKELLKTLPAGPEKDGMEYAISLYEESMDMLDAPSQANAMMISGAVLTTIFSLVTIAGIPLLILCKKKA